MSKIASLFGTRRRRLLAVAAVVLVAAATWYVGRSDADEGTSTTTTAEVTSSTVEDTVTGSGTLESAKSSTLSFSSSGTVTKVYVEAGDTVAKGARLAKIDTTSLAASLASAEAQLDAAETTAADDGDESSAQQAANTAAVASAEADVADAEEALDGATLTAPFAGMVASVGYEQGDSAGSSSSGGSATGGSGATTSTETTGITVISPKKFTVTADVSADDVERITKGMQAEVTPSGATEAVFGTVQEVGRVAETSTDGTATFPVTIALTGTQEGLYAGTSADVSVIVESRADVLTVPTAALTTEDDQAYVTKVVDGTTEKTKVEIGDTFGMTTEITSGLTEGDEVQYTVTARMPGGSGRESGEQGGFPGGGEMPDFSGGGMPPGGMPGGGS